MVKKKELTAYRLIIFSRDFYTLQSLSFKNAILNLANEIEITYVVFSETGLFSFLFHGKIRKRIKKFFENNQKINKNLKLFSTWKLIPYSRYFWINKVNKRLSLVLLKWIINCLESKNNIVWFLNKSYYPLVGYFNEVVSIFDTLDIKNKISRNWQEEILINNRLMFFIFRKRKQKKCLWVKYSPDATIVKRIRLVFKSLNRLLK